MTIIKLSDYKTSSMIKEEELTARMALKQFTDSELRQLKLIINAELKERKTKTDQKI